MVPWFRALGTPLTLLAVQDAIVWMQTLSTGNANDHSQRLAWGMWARVGVEEANWQRIVGAGVGWGAALSQRGKAGEYSMLGVHSRWNIHDRTLLE